MGKIEFNKQAFKICRKNKSSELWLEFGYVQKNNWHEMLWYNEGRAEEFGYFIKNFIKELFTPKMYFLIRYMGLSIAIKGTLK